MIKIHTIWVNSEPTSDGIWMVDGWDEFSIDDNPEGWTAALKKAQSEYPMVRVIIIETEWKAIKKAFEADVVPGTVVE